MSDLAATAAIGQLRLLELLVGSEEDEGRVAESLDAATALRALQAELEAEAVARARAAGWSWNRIASHLGVSRQAAIKRHGASEVATSAA